MEMRTHIYIDGFNFYYGAVKGTPFKWLDFKVLFSLILKPKHLISRIKYFTAVVSATPQDAGKPIRQKTYIRALQAYIPEIEIHYGHFLSHKVSMPLVNPSSLKYFEDVIKTEEKGSDVNLAVHLVNDAWLDLYGGEIGQMQLFELGRMFCQFFVNLPAGPYCIRVAAGSTPAASTPVVQWWVLTSLNPLVV
jgi:hypothetical protein